MSFDLIIELVYKSFTGSAKSVYTIARVVIPIMVLMEAGRAYRVLDRVAERAKRFTRVLGLSGEAAFPLTVGVIFGLAFGAGVIIQWAKEGTLKKRDLYLLSFFLISCHAVIEDTLVFVAIGANGALLLGCRLTAAVLTTLVLSKRLPLERDLPGSLQSKI
ncbi:MAG: nucleoside recognition protein [Bacillota bacterium]|nr:nucleoside recognition protein [Bacillota bacterium]